MVSIVLLFYTLKPLETNKLWMDDFLTIHLNLFWSGGIYFVAGIVLVVIARKLYKMLSTYKKMY